MKSPLKMKLPIIPGIVKTTIFYFILFISSLRLLGLFLDPDMWWHIKLGADILNSKWVNTLTFTCTDYTWINHSWLADVLMYLVHSIGGFQALSVFFAGIFLAGITLSMFSLKVLLIHSGAKNSRLNTLLYFLFFILVLSSFIAIRPQVFTFLFFNILIFVLIKFYYSTNLNFKKLLLFVPFFILWVNLHGGFVIGIALIGLFLIDILFNFLVSTFRSDFPQAKLLLRKCKYLALLLIIFLVSSLFNPFGLDLWREIFTLVLGSNNATFITEWRAINIKDTYFLFYFLLFLAGIVLQGINKKKSSLRLMLLISFGLLSLYSVRYILPISGIVLLVVFTEANILYDWLYKKILITDKDIRRLLNLLKYLILFFIAIAAGIGAYLSINFFINLNNLDNSDIHSLYPIEAKTYLVANESLFSNLNFYNTYVWGGYLEYNLPQHNWFIDGRMPEWHCKGKVKDNIMLDYIEVENVKKSWRDVLIKYNVEAIIIKTDGQLSNFISEDIDWQLVHEDKLASIYIKNQ